jgi:hypothetical protein
MRSWWMWLFIEAIAVGVSCEKWRLALGLVAARAN